MHCLEGRERRGLLCTGCGSCAVESYLIESFICRGLSKGRGRKLPGPKSALSAAGREGEREH